MHGSSGSAALVEADKIVGGGSEGELDSNLPQATHAEGTQVTLFLERAEDGFDDGFASLVDMSALEGAHAEEPGIAAAAVLDRVAGPNVELPGQAGVQHPGIDLDGFHPFYVVVGVITGVGDQAAGRRSAGSFDQLHHGFQ